MFGINEKIYDNLLDYFNKEDNIYKVILFGSRATGKYKYNSDIDLCIGCFKNKGTIANTIDEIIGIYSCDIVFLNSIDDKLKNQIERDGINIYENTNLNEAFN